MLEFIPTEMIIEIFTWLPVKSLLRFTLVCKLWYSTITNPNFITTHLSRSRERDTSQILLTFRTLANPKNFNYFLLHDDGKSDESGIELAFPSKTLTGDFYLVGSCDGLICLHSEIDNVFIILNPCVRKSVTLIPPAMPRSKKLCTTGFGFLSGKSNYKVVRIVHCRIWNQGTVTPEVEVYEQGEGEWRGIKCAPSHYSKMRFTRSRVYLREALHWIASDQGYTYGKLIIVFEMVGEAFREIALPPNLTEYPSCLTEICLFKGSLAVLCGGDYGRGECSVWVMREYGVFESWSNLYNVSLPDLLFRRLGLRKNGDLLFTTCMGLVSSFHCKAENVTYTGVQGWPSTFEVSNFKESLLLS